MKNQEKTIKVPSEIHLLLRKLSVEEGVGRTLPLYSVIALLLLDYFLEKQKKQAKKA